MASGLDANSFRIVRLQTDSQRPIYPMQRDRTFAMAESVSASSPVLEAGESKVSVTVRGEIEVERRQFPVE